MSESELVQTIAAVVRDTHRRGGRGGSDVNVARAIVTGLSAAGYEIVRTRPVPAETESRRGVAVTPPRPAGRAPARRAG